jgi:hypothetical protein
MVRKNRTVQMHMRYFDKKAMACGIVITCSLKFQTDLAKTAQKIPTRETYRLGAHIIYA